MMIILHLLVVLALFAGEYRDASIFRRQGLATRSRIEAQQSGVHG